MLKRTLGVASLIAVIGYVSIGAQSAQGQGFFNKMENAVENADNRMKFEEWANQHPDWVATHHDRYEFFKHHPEEAEKFRSEWYGWHAERNAERNAKLLQFSEWASQHPEWVSSHHDRYQFFMHHPEKAEESRSEWWTEQGVERHAERIQFSQWASNHPEWVSEHHDRYEFFMHHPEKAEEFRSEWYEWHH